MEYIKKIYGVNIEDLPGDSYLREIPFLKNFKGMEIDSPVTFLWAKMERVSQHFLKPWQ